MKTLQNLMPDLPPQEIAMLNATADGLSEDGLRTFSAVYRWQRKEPMTIALSAFFFGWAGGHYWYLGNTPWAVGYFFTIGGGLYIGSIIDVFRCRSLAMNANRLTADMIAANLR